MASTSHFSNNSLAIPAYLWEAACHYQSTSIGHARATIRLALSVTAYYEDLAAGVFGNVAGHAAPKKFVMKVLTKDLSAPFEKSFACRLFAVGELCHHVEEAGLTMDRIRSQGALFALAALVKRATEQRLSLDLKEALDDAAKLTIAEFRQKWCRTLHTEQTAAARSDLIQVLRWISKAKDRNALRKVAAATYQRLAMVANSQQSLARRTDNLP